MPLHELPRDTKLIDIPTIEDTSRMAKAQAKAWQDDFESCPCCGKAIKNEVYFINSAYGGMAYPSNMSDEFSDCWIMAVGSECRKKFPEGYVFKK